jgi:DNA-binding MarR family transcriptional regulator
LVILITGQLLGPSSIARLARELVMDRSTLTRNLKPLLNMGLVCFTRGDAGRQKAVEVTVEGQAALLRAAPYWNSAQTHLVNRFGPDNWNRIIADLSGIVEATRSSAV